MGKTPAKRAANAAPTTQPTGRNVATVDPATELMNQVLGKVESIAGISEIGGERDQIKMQTVGEFIVARIAGVREAVNFEGRIFDLDGRNEDQKFFMVGSTDLDRKLTDKVVGNVVGIFFVGLTDVGQTDPMKTFRVFDFGNDWPDLPQFENFAAADDSEPLPF